jgi:hypothetical protein
MKGNIKIVLLFLLVYANGNAQSLLSEWQIDKNKIEIAYKNAKTNYEKDTTKREAKRSLDSLDNAKRIVDLRIEAGENSLNDLITGQYIARIDSLHGKVDYLTKTIDNQGMRFPWEIMLLVILLLAIAILSVMVYILWDPHKRRDEILKTVANFEKKEGSHRMEIWKNSLIEEVIKKVKPLLPPPPDATGKSTLTAETDLVIQDLSRRLTLLEDNFRTVPVENVNPTSKDEVGESILAKSVKLLYADAIVNGEFNKVTDHPNDDTIFELLLNVSSGKTASFVIYKDAYRRVLKNADFIDGCEKQRINFNPTNLNVIKGETSLLDNGKWQIAKKAEVKFV